MELMKQNVKIFQRIQRVIDNERLENMLVKYGPKSLNYNK